MYGMHILLNCLTRQGAKWLRKIKLAWHHVPLCTLAEHPLVPHCLQARRWISYLCIYEYRLRLVKGGLYSDNPDHDAP